jgi:DNA-directed RNA polymerase beta' subunit
MVREKCGYSTKTANSGYLTRRLIDVGQDILIREKTV